MKTCLYKLEKIVEYVLVNYEDTRSDDFVLIYRVYKEINEAAMIRELFCEIMINHNKYELPSFESIVRSRRKVFEKCPKLKPKHITKLREEKERKYREYSKS